MSNSTFQGWRPRSTRNVSDQDLRDIVDDALQRIFTIAYTLSQTSVTAPVKGQGYAQVNGFTTVTGSKTGIVAGLTTVTNVAASVDAGTTPVSYTVSARPSATVQGAIDIYVYQPTAAGNTTPVLATSAVTIRWVATGS